MKKSQILILFILALLVSAVILPNGKTVPGRDSGVFLYTGQRVLAGEIPYRDLWDHKPPLIYLLNVLGLFIAGGSIWGVVFLEFLSAAAAALICFYLIKKYFGLFPALLGTLAFLAGLATVLQGGNFTEEFALPFQFASLYIFAKADPDSDYAAAGFYIGVLSAICFYLRQNLISVGAAIVIYIVWRRLKQRKWRQLNKDLAVITSGALVVTFIIIFYFLANDALAAFWDVAFRHNFIYSKASNSARFKSFISGIKTLPLTLVVIITWCWSVYRRYSDKAENYPPVLVVTLIGLPIEFLFSNLRGVPHGHYYLPWLPYLAVLSGFFAWYLINLVSKANRWKNYAVATVEVLLALLLIGFSVYPAKKPLLAKYNEMFLAYQGQYRSYSSLRYQAARYAAETTGKDDYILVWGAEAMIYFLSGRRSPTRFFYQYPLITKGYTSESLMVEFFDAINSRKPKLVIDTLGIPLTRSGMSWPHFSEFKEIARDYVVDKKIQNWIFYTRKPGA